MLLLPWAAPASGASHAPAPHVPGEAPSPGLGWQPRGSALDAFSLRNIRPAEMTHVISKLDALDAIFRKVPVLANPDGFEVGSRVRWRQDVGATSRDELYSYDYRLRFFVPSYKEASEVLRTIVVTVNPYPALLVNEEKPILTDGEKAADEIYIERPKSTPKLGATAIYDSLIPGAASYVQVLFVSGAESPWTPVSRERYLKAEIAEAEAGEGKTAEVYSQTSYQRWLREAPQRKAIRDAAVAQVMATDRAKGEELRKTLEQTEQEVGQRMKEAEASERQEARALADAPSRSGQLRARLQAMSPEERAQQAFLLATDAASMDFVTADTPQAEPLVAYNPAFYRAPGSLPLRARSIVVYMEIEGDPIPDSALLDQVMVKVFKTLDWAAIARLLD
jgi:hypothetical protein